MPVMEEAVIRDYGFRMRCFSPVSGILYAYSVEFTSLSFIWPSHHCNDLAAYPPGSGEQPLNPGIFGLATRKVYPVAMSPSRPVGSYPTFSPLLRPRFCKIVFSIQQNLRRSGYFLRHLLSPDTPEPSC